MSGRVRRTTPQIERDRADIARLYVRGKKQHEIAETLNRVQPRRPYAISRGMVAYDLGAIRKAWLESALMDFNTKRAEQLAKIDYLEATAWDAWEKSLLESSSSTQYANANPEGDATPSRLVLHTSPGAGDPRYLAVVQWCIDRRIRLLGLDEPETLVQWTVQFDVKDWMRQREERLRDVGLMPTEYQVLAEHVDAA